MHRRRLPPRSSRSSALYQLGIDSAAEASSSGDEYAGTSSSDDDFEEPTADNAVPESGARWRQVTPHEDRSASTTPFLGTPGLNPDIAIPDDAGVRFFVNMFLTEELINNLREWTNTRVLQDLDEEDNASELRDETIFSNDDIKKFIGIFLLMGLNKKPNIRQYWSQDPLYKQDFFSRPECLPRNRFLRILRYIRFADYENLAVNDNLQKVRPFLEAFNHIVENVYMPEQNVAVDESLMLFKGRLKIRQYIPNKRNRYGVKSYLLCESESGYCFQIQTHSVSSENKQIGSHIQGAESLSCSERIVVSLMEKLLHLGYRCYVDNFYASVRLAMFLLEKQTLMVGTIRANRGIPKFVIDTPVEACSHKYFRDRDVLVSKVVDKKSSGKKTIYLISTSHVAEDVTVERYVKGGRSESILKPKIVTDYNRFMGAVDLLDGSLHPYDANRKMYTWFVKYGLHVIQILVRNSWVLYCKYSQNITFMHFIEKVINEMVMETGIIRRSALLQRSLSPSPSKQHYPKRILARPNEKHPSKRCRICHSNGRRKHSVFVCSSCPGEPGLCIDPCFKMYHAK